MIIKENNGKVNFIMRAGQDFVRDTMTVSAANATINVGKATTSDRFPGYGIAVNDIFFFEGTMVDPEPVKKAAKRRDHDGV
jgi:hypothetical protein